jgi:hypothetical protein
MDLQVGILSWNIGQKASNSYKKIEELVTSYKKATPKLPDILIVGFQELGRVLKRGYTSSVDTWLLDVLNRDQHTDKYVLIENVFACTAILMNFEIHTCVFSRSSRFSKVKTTSTSSCIKPYRKGYTQTKITFGGKTANFINVHYPLSNKLEHAVTAFNRMEKESKDFASKASVQFVFGDVNARTILTKQCYRKDVTSCLTFDEQSEYETFCEIKKELEALDTQSLKATFYYQDTDIESRCLVSCDSRDPLPDNWINLQKLLVNNDSINQNQLCSKTSNVPDIFKGYTESPIYFWPTYKRNTATGHFSLIKKDEGRLPGYADRILWKQNLNDVMVYCKDYKSLWVTGNDHMPIYGNFVIRFSSAGGGAKAKSKKTFVKKSYLLNGKKSYRYYVKSPTGKLTRVSLKSYRLKQ